MGLLDVVMMNVVMSVVVVSGDGECGDQCGCGEW